MPSFRSAVIDGRTVLIPDEPAPGHRNPPLAVLNAQQRADSDERDEDTAQAVAAAGQAIGHALRGRSAPRPTRKPLRPVPAAPGAA